MSKKINEIKERVYQSIEKTMSVIEKICPQGNVCLGIKVRDTYHNNGDVPAFSMFTAGEMLWAITSTGLYSKSHYLTAGLLTLVNTELEGNYFKKKDRTYEKAFVLLGTTAAGQSITTTVYLNTIKSILEIQKVDGSWGSYSAGNSDIRATALCILALTECYQYVGVGKDAQPPFSKIEGSIIRACDWLLRQYSREGYCKRHISNFDEYSDMYTFGIELTAWSTYALIKVARCLTNYPDINHLTKVVHKSIQWLCGLGVQTIAKTPENEIEEYKKDSNTEEILRHDYGAGGLEITIIALVEYRKSPFYNYIRNFDNSINEFVLCLLTHENENGEWWDKNSDSYGRAWTISYALKALSVFYEYLCESEEFITQLKKMLRVNFLSVLAWLYKYWIALFFVSVTVLLFAFMQAIQKKFAFFNSPIITATGFVLSVIGVIQGRRK